MYAVMFYVILNKRKLHFPLAKNVMHSPSYLPRNARVIGERERASGTIFLYPALMYAVMFYVILNKRKRLGDCVTFSYLISVTHTVMFLNMRYMRKTHARILDVKCQGAASYHAFSQQRRLPVLSDLFVVWSGVHVSCTSHQLDRSRSPKMHCIHLLVFFDDVMFLCAVSKTRYAPALFLFSIIQMAAGNSSQPLIPYKPPAPAADRVLNTNDAVDVLEAVLPAQNKSYELGLKFKLPPHEVKAIHSPMREPRECLRDVIIRFLEGTEPGPT